MKKSEKKIIDKNLSDIMERLMYVRGSVEALGGLCFTHGGEMPLDVSEIHGLGLLLQMLNAELMEVVRTVDRMSLDLSRQSKGKAQKK